MLIYHTDRLYCGGFYCFVYSSSDYVLHNLLLCMAAKHTGLELAKTGVCISNAVYHLQVSLVRCSKRHGGTSGLQLDLSLSLFLIVTVAPLM